MPLPKKGDGILYLPRRFSREPLVSRKWKDTARVILYHKNE